MNKMLSKIITKNLKNAEYDLKFLLNRGYRKKSGLSLVANKYLLNRDERNLLVRKVYSNEKAYARRVKIVNINNIRNKTIIIDGYNVLITSEIIYKQEYSSLILCDDGFLRDIKAVFGKYKNSTSSEKAIINILTILKHHVPRFIYFIYDSPVSKSGELAKLTESLIKTSGIDGCAVTNKNVDLELVKLSKKNEGIVATSDGPVIDRVEHVLDIPYWICKKKI
jgi:hypothetical protein